MPLQFALTEVEQLRYMEWADKHVCRKRRKNRRTAWGSFPGGTCFTFCPNSDGVGTTFVRVYVRCVCGSRKEITGR